MVQAIMNHSYLPMNAKMNVAPPRENDDEKLKAQASERITWANELSGVTEQVERRERAS